MISGQEHPDHEHDEATDVCTLVPKHVFSRYFQRGKMKNFTVLALAICLFVSQEPPHTTCRSYCIKPPQISASFVWRNLSTSRQPDPLIWIFNRYLPWSSSNMTRINEKHEYLASLEMTSLGWWSPGPPRNGDEGDGDSAVRITWLW